ncbi:MAG: hypothetical protein E7256_11145 [Lachnospiraceae bacterium]|nr:hypothetical protein [Lachnospiraceae bacterium]
MKKQRNRYRNVIVLLLLCIFVGAFGSGCGKKEGVDETVVGMSQATIEKEEAIHKIIVTYYDSENNTKKITIDLDAKTKSTKIIDQNAEETSQAYEDTESLESFIRETVLPEVVNEEKANSDDQKVVWRIEVRGESHNVEWKGFVEYPSFWDDLLKYLGE